MTINEFYEETDRLEKFFGSSINSFAREIWFGELKKYSKDDIVIDDEMNNNLNILLSIPESNIPSWEGYNYIINRECAAFGESTSSFEAIKNDDEYSWEKRNSVPSYLEGKTFAVKIALSDLGLENDFTIDVKVCDGLSNPSNILNYYVDGDSAPIGRLNYRYHAGK